MKIGKSKFTIGTLAGFLIGIFLANFFMPNWWWLGIIIVFLAFALWQWWPNIFYRLVVFCLLGLFLGFGYFKIYDQIQNNHHLVYGQDIKIQGVIAAPPKIMPTKIQAILKYENTQILIDLPRYPEYQYGDVLEFDGNITDPRTIQTIDNFNYGKYLLHQNTRGWAKNPQNIQKIGEKGNGVAKVIYHASQTFQDTLSKTLPEPYASFQIGLLFGNRSVQIPDSLTSAFNRTGTTHMVAVSGYNVTIIVSSLALCFALFSRRFSFWASLLVIVVFIVMTGASASVIRAGILGILVSWGRLEGRRINHIILLLFTASVMLLFNPYQIQNDISFQLSFLAFSGLVFVSTKIKTLPLVNKLPSVIGAVFAETMGAQIMCLPILIYNFGMISLVAPLVNVLVLPFVPLAMFLGFLTGLSGLVWLKLGQFTGNLSWIVLKYILVIVESFSRFSWAAVLWKLSDWWWIPPYYAIILSLVYQGKQLKEKTQNE